MTTSDRDLPYDVIEVSLREVSPEAAADFRARRDAERRPAEELSTRSPGWRAEILESLTAEDRRRLAGNRDFVESLKQVLRPGEFADTAARLIVHVDPRAHEPASARAEARAQAARMLQDPETTARLLSKGVHMVVIPRDVHLTEVGPFQRLRSRDHQNANGSYGYAYMRGLTWGTATAVGEENLLGEASSAGPGGSFIGQADGYSTATHEFAHLIHRQGLTEADQGLITSVYQNKIAQGEQADWPNGRLTGGNGVRNYSSLNEDEYFAHLSNAYLGTNHGTDPDSGQRLNNGADWVRANESDLLPLLERLYGPDPSAVHSRPANPYKATQFDNAVYHGFNEFMGLVDGEAGLERLLAMPTQERGHQVLQLSYRERDQIFRNPRHVERLRNELSAEEVEDLNTRVWTADSIDSLLNMPMGRRLWVLAGATPEQRALLSSMLPHTALRENSLEPAAIGEFRGQIRAAAALDGLFDTPHQDRVEALLGLSHEDRLRIRQNEALLERWQAVLPAQEFFEFMGHLSGSLGADELIGAPAAERVAVLMNLDFEMRYSLTRRSVLMDRVQSALPAEEFSALRAQLAAMESAYGLIRARPGDRASVVTGLTAEDLVRLEADVALRDLLGNGLSPNEFDELMTHIATAARTDEIVTADTAARGRFLTELTADERTALGSNRIFIDRVKYRLSPDEFEDFMIRLATRHESGPGHGTDPRAAQAPGTAVEAPRAAEDAVRLTDETSPGDAAATAAPQDAADVHGSWSTGAWLEYLLGMSGAERNEQLLGFTALDRSRITSNQELIDELASRLPGAEFDDLAAYIQAADTAEELLGMSPQVRAQALDGLTPALRAELAANQILLDLLSRRRSDASEEILGRLGMAAPADGRRGEPVSIGLDDAARHKSGPVVVPEPEPAARLQVPGPAPVVVPEAVAQKAVVVPEPVVPQEPAAVPGAPAAVEADRAWAWMADGADVPGPAVVRGEQPQTPSAGSVGRPPLAFLDAPRSKPTARAPREEVPAD